MKLKHLLIGGLVVALGMLVFFGMGTIGPETGAHKSEIGAVENEPGPVDIVASAVPSDETRPPEQKKERVNEDVRTGAPPLSKAAKLKHYLLMRERVKKAIEEKQRLQDKEPTAEQQKQWFDGLNAQLNPLIDACYEDLTDPPVGVLSVKWFISYAENVGGVIERVELDEDVTELRHPELYSCIEDAIWEVDYAPEVEGFGELMVTQNLEFGMEEE